MIGYSSGAGKIAASAGALFVGAIVAMMV